MDLNHPKHLNFPYLCLTKFFISKYPCLMPHRRSFYSFLICAVLLAFPQLLNAQSTLDSAAKIHLNLAVDAESFFYNGEFAHPIKPGYTLPGVVLRPALTFQYTDRIATRLGWHASYMFGANHLMVSCPLLTLHVVPIRPLSFMFGALPDIRQHRLPQYVYSSQHTWLTPPEMGVRVAYEHQLLQAETWIDWQKFIWRYADSQEEFLYGARFALTTFRQQLETSLFLLAAHLGGQIDTIDAPTVTSLNVGAIFSYTTPHLTSWGLALGAQLDGAYSSNGAPIQPLPSSKGWASRLTLLAAVQGGILAVGYYYAQNFHTLRGDQFYASHSNWNPAYITPNRSMLTARIEYNHHQLQMAHLHLSAELFYDIPLRQFDYAFLLSLRIPLNLKIL